MPKKNKNSKKVSSKNSGLFSCISAPEEEVEVFCTH